MKNKRWLVVIVLVFLIFACKKSEEKPASAESIPAPEKEAKAEIILKSADDHPPDYPTTQGLFYMARYLEEKSGGRIKMRVYHSAQLGSEKETIEQTQFGAIDLDRVNINPVTQISKTMIVLAMPFLFKNKEHLHRVLDGKIGKKLLEDLEPYGLVGLGYYDAGARSFYNSHRPIYKPEDLKGLKIRVQKSQIMIDMVRALGASPTPMAFEEVYTALQTGVIDGAENNFPSYYYTRHYEVAKYYSLDEHCWSPEVLLFSKKTWERLSEADRRLIQEAALASVIHQRKLWEEYEKKAEQKLRQAGVKINQIKEITAFQKAVEPVYEKYLKDPKIKELIEEIRTVGKELE